MTISKSWLILIIALLALSCGGGGGEGDSLVESANQIENSPFIKAALNISDRQKSNPENTEVTLVTLDGSRKNMVYDETDNVYVTRAGELNNSDSFYIEANIDGEPYTLVYLGDSSFDGLALNAGTISIDSNTLSQILINDVMGVKSDDRSLTKALSQLKNKPELKNEWMNTREKVDRGLLAINSLEIYVGGRGSVKIITMNHGKFINGAESIEFANASNVVGKKIVPLTGSGAARVLFTPAEGSDFTSYHGYYDVVPTEEGAFYDPIEDSLMNNIGLNHFQFGKFPLNKILHVKYDLQFNHTPLINSANVLTATTGNVMTHTATVNDQDGDVPFFSLENEPSGMVIDPQTGVLTWTPEEATDITFKIIATDLSFSSKQNVEVTVTER